MTRLVTLIPAYKTDFLSELFMGLRSQTYRNFQVVLSDDSPDAQITAQIRSGRFDALLQTLELLVVPGPRQGSLKNIQHLLRGWGVDADLVHIHLDDDVMYPDFYREHVRAHASAKVGASVSMRWVTDVNGRPLATLPVPDFIDQHSARSLQIPAEAMFASTVPKCANWLGEISNTVLSAEGARHYCDARMAGLSYYGLCDIGTMLSVSRQAPIAFIRDHLSGFRSNPQQSSANTQSFGLRCGHIAWVALALAARREGRISDAQTVRSVATSMERAARVYLNEPSMADFFTLIGRHGQNLSELDSAFEPYWAAFLETDTDSLTVAPLPQRSIAPAEAALACA